MKVLLDGYFDSNFGDDYMMKLIVNYLPELEFLIDPHEKVSPIVTEEKNARFNLNGENAPKIIVTGSGFMINSSEALYCELKWFLQRKHIGDYCVGCNIEAFDNPIKEYLIKKKLQKFKMIVCRDKPSYSWLIKNCKKTKIYYLPDILFSMPDKWINKNNIKNKLGISILHRPEDTEDCKYYQAMAKTADYWIEKTGKEVYLLAFNTGSEDDVFACECVKKKMRFYNNAKIIKHGTKCEIMQAYSECEKVIGARFHSGVLAIRMGIDFYPIIYRDKTRNLIQDMDYPQTGCYIDNINLQSIQDFINKDKLGYKLNPKVVLDASKYADLLRKNIRERM